jgi:Ca-activated chloride channel family protein
VTTASTTAFPFPGTAPAGLTDLEGRPFPLLGARLSALAEGGVARSTLEQRYVNPHEEPLEVIYTLPLPADGAVIGYVIEIGGRRITGHVEAREQAQAEYARALEEGRTAGLLEQERADTFTQRLGALPAGATATLEIEVLHPLAFRQADGGAAARMGDGAGDATDEGVAGGNAEDAADDATARGARWEYRFPTVVGVRYEGGPGRVADAPRLDVERATRTPARLELELDIADGSAAALAPRSSSHAIDGTGGDAERTRVRLAAPAPLDRDVVVTWNATSADIGVRLAAGGGLEGDDGHYGLLTVTPPRVPAATYARDLTVLVDASGSMSGAPLERAKAIVDRLLDGLGPDDRFEVLAFASRVVRLDRGRGTDDGPRPATDPAIDGARRALRRLSAGGGTEMANAIDRALAPLRADSQRQVVLLTDGYIGFEHEVIGRLVRDLPAGARLHAVGVGTAPNRTLISGAARAGRGIELVVGNDADVVPAARRLGAATRAPVLTELAIAGDVVRAVAPERPRDILAGQPLVVTVELATTGGTIEVTGRLAGQAAPWKASIPVPAATPETPTDHPTAWHPSALPLGALFGREAVADTEMRLAARLDDGASEGLLGRIEALGLRHRIATRRTSLVAIADAPSVDPREPRRRERLPVELPAEVSAEGVGLMGGMPHTMAWGGDVQCLVSMPTARAATAPPPPHESCLGIDAYEESRAASATKRLFERLFRAATQMRPAAAPGGTQAFIARCVRRDHDRLVIEFEAPGGDFELPATRDALEAVLPDGRKLEARIDAGSSTRPGPIKEGMTVRLVIVLAHEPGRRGEWEDGTVTIVWPGDTRGARRGRRRGRSQPPLALIVTLSEPLET